MYEKVRVVLSILYVVYLYWILRASTEKKTHYSKQDNFLPLNL